jgi:hypothetical protein
LFDAPEEKSLRTLRYELDLTESTIAKLQGRIDELRKSPTLGFTTFIDTAQISALQSKIDELSRVRGQTQARIAFLEGPPERPHAAAQTPPPPDDTAGVKDRAERLQRIQEGLENTLFSITHEGSERIIAEHERRVAEIEALRAKDGSNAEQVDRLVEQSAAVREAQLSQLRAKEAEAAERVWAANDRVVEGLNAERAALTSTERERFVAQALSRLSAEATAAQRREVEELAGALYDEQQALQARQRLMDEGRSVVDRDRAVRGRGPEAGPAARCRRDRPADLQPGGRGCERPGASLKPGLDRWCLPVPEGLCRREPGRCQRGRTSLRASLFGRGGRPDRLRHDRQARDQGSRGQRACRHHAHGGAPDDHGTDCRAPAGCAHKRRVRPVPRRRGRG